MLRSDERCISIIAGLICGKRAAAFLSLVNKLLFVQDDSVARIGKIWGPSRILCKGDAIGESVKAETGSATLRLLAFLRIIEAFSSQGSVTLFSIERPEHFHV